jgi:hypothetical protein
MTKSKAGQVSITKAEYKKLISRPKQSTLKRDKRQGNFRKGKASNPYLQTLLDPVRVTGVKVPDVSSFPTSTFQTYFLAETTIGAGGYQSYFFQPVAQDFAAASNTSGGAVGNWSTIGDASAIAAAIHSLRPVSGLLRVTTTASSTNNQGEVIGVVLPTNQTLTVLTTATQFGNRFGAFRTPLKDGMEYLWMPLDPKSRSFVGSSATATDGIISDTFPAVAACVTGAAATTVVRFEMWFNWEAVPEDAVWNLLNATAPYISGRDMEEATGFLTNLGSLGHRYGEDIGSWLLDQGAVAAAAAGSVLAKSAVHYVNSRVGLRGGPNSPIIHY